MEGIMADGNDRKSLFLPFLVIFLGLVSTPALAQCNASPIAIDDLAFHEGRLIIVDVLANDVEPNGEALTVTNISTTCAGTLAEDFGLVSLEPPAPVAEDCTISYQVVDESGNSASATVVVQSIGLLFEDGFESGDTTGWSEEVG
jgi:Bacterial Ig domain